MTTDRERAELDEIDALAARFPAVHEATDCLAFVHRLAPLLRGIFHLDEPKEEGSARAVKEGCYTFDDARAIAIKLKAVAAIDETSRVFDTPGLIRQLAPDIKALAQRNFTLAWVAKTLAGLGVHVTDTVLFDLVYPTPPLDRL